MKRVLLILFILAAATLFGCSREDAQSMLGTADLEEKQHNKEHAIEIYEEIIKRYPDSDAARKAKDRISALRNPAASSTPPAGAKPASTPGSAPGRSALGDKPGGTK